VIAWWWAPFTFVAGCLVTFVFCAHLNQSIIRESIGVREENERLHRRIQLIGERKLDGTQDYKQGER